MNSFETALIEIVKELESEHDFYFDETGEEELISTIRKHLAPLIDIAEYKKQQIVMLRAQLKELERRVGRHF